MGLGSGVPLPSVSAHLQGLFPLRVGDHQEEALEGLELHPDLAVAITITITITITIAISMTITITLAITISITIAITILLLLLLLLLAVLSRQVPHPSSDW